MFGTYCRLNVTVYAPPKEVVRAVYKKCTPFGRHHTQRKARHRLVRKMLRIHHEQTELMRKFRL